MTGDNTVLLVDDEEQILLSYGLVLRTSGFENVLTVHDGRKVMPVIASGKISLVVLDLIMPHVPGAELLDEITRDYPHIPVIVMTATNEVDMAVECMKRGAFDYLVKPVEKSRFVAGVRRGLELKELRDEVSSLKSHFLSDGLRNEAAFSSYITKSVKMLSIFRYAEAVAATTKPVCICGETGVGKELLAKIVYNISGLKGNYVAVNAAGLDDTIFSDTLFGHKKGAFTGAEGDRDGLIRQASGGALLLDEIGDIRESSQLKLLRLLEEHKYYPLGSDNVRTSDARIITTTNRDIKKLVASGKFRKDLYYRLWTHSIHIPPLRERKEDIPLLFENFLEAASQAAGKKKPSYPRSLITALSNHPFPGNVRELQAMVFDAVAQHTKGMLTISYFEKFINNQAGKDSRHAATDASGEFAFPPDEGIPTLKKMEEALIREALKRSDSNQNIASSLLGISRQALNKRLRRKSKG
ncbi:MAG: sigma-54-dependent Fis family transcriptional regulator [Nitrospirae bacterium]|nr:sigma-54-dependent Fis family transcriptional regulator [Nitrospirota bacterium]